MQTILNLWRENGTLLMVIAVPLKYLRSFWRSLKMSLINYKVELKLKWTKHCILSAADNDNNINESADVNNILFTIK